MSTVLCGSSRFCRRSDSCLGSDVISQVAEVIWRLEIDETFSFNGVKLPPQEAETHRAHLFGRIRTVLARFRSPKQGAWVLDPAEL